AVGTLRELLQHQESITGQCLRQKKSFPARGKRRPVVASTSRLELRDAAANNLKNLTVSFPINRFVVVTGVSGSGKSTLIRECLLPAVQSALARRSKSRPLTLTLSSGGGERNRLSAAEEFQAVYEVDQSPIGR